MPDAKVNLADRSLPEQAQPGLFGKLPSRGDFVRVGLPRGFVQPWDDWLQQVIAGSRARLGEAWLPAWMEAPIWRFGLPAGMCGPDQVLGVVLPSVDRAGRHFPLTLAVTVPAHPPADLAGLARDWLPVAEAAGLAALQDDLAPDAVAALLTQGPPALDVTDAAPPDLVQTAAGRALWWTEGSPFVPAGTRILADLPDIAEFTLMLDATSAKPPDATVMPADGGRDDGMGET